MIISYRPAEPKGYQEGKHTKIMCASCSAPLANILVVKPDEPIIRTVRPIDCPWCGDHSFVVEVSGGIFTANTEFCDTIEMNETNNVLTIKVIKGSRKWQKQK